MENWLSFVASSLTSVTIPNSVTSIESWTFGECKNLTSITIPNSVTSIGELAFYYCSGLTSVEIPNSVKSIGENAFCSCKALTFITIPNSVTSIGNSAFSSCYNLTSVTIPNSVTSIGENAFDGCSNLSSVTIPNSVTSIGEFAFYCCSGLTSITIPNSVTSIERSTFWGCSSLTSINIPNSVTSIGEYAFLDCSSLSSVNIPNSVKYINSNAFKDCYILEKNFVNHSNCGNGSITFVDKEQNDGLLINNNIVVKCRSWATSVTIPNSVTSIGGGAFRDCSGLTSITIPNSVMSIGIWAFEYCSGLTSITCEATTPPGCEYECFNKVNRSVPVYVPANSVEAYKKASEWSTFTNIQAIDNQSIANVVIEKIDVIGKVEYTDACKDKIDAASTAYNALTDDQKALVSNLDVLTTAKQTYEALKAAAEKLAADKAAANKVVNKIKAIGTVEYTDDCKSKIDAASKAYEALADDQKALVTNLDVLTTAKQTYDALKAAADKLVADKAKADAVIAKINAIGNIEYTYACKDKIDEANDAYNTLTADQKALVTNLDILKTAKQTYDNLKAAAEKLAADKAKADPVIAKINAIGKVEYTYACKDKIDEANNAYNALTADQKALVTNLDVLKTAKQTYDNLKAAAEKLAADKAAFDKYKSEIIAIIESLVKEDDSDAVKEIINKAISEIDALKYEDAISLDDNKAKINSFATSVNEAVENQRAEDEKTNGIEEPELAEKVNIYDLNGRKITNSMLKSGLYIRNGKKVVVK